MVWAIDSIAPYKSLGMDGIFPALLQEGWGSLSLTWLRFLVPAWRLAMFQPHGQIKVVFIPKPSRNSYGGPKDF